MARVADFVLTQPGPLRLYSTVELLRLPPPTYIVDGILPENGFVGLYGPPGHGKSFVAVHTAMCIGTGTPWFGNPVEKGFSLYISAEGGAGIGKRVGAWCQHFRVPPSKANVAWLTEAITVQEDTATMEKLFDRIQNEVEQHPTLIVIDTLARCFEGNENAQEDMSRFVKGVDAFRREFKSAVVIVHHTREDGTRERGSTAFKGAADTMISCYMPEEYRCTVKCEKQKDEEAFKELSLQLRKVDVQMVASPKPVTSCVLVMDAVETESHLERALRDAGALSYSALEAALIAQGISRSTLKRRVKQALLTGKVTRENGLYTWCG